LAQTLDVVATIDRHVPKRGTQGPSVGQYLLLAALNRCLAPTSKAKLAEWYGKTVLTRLLPLSSTQLTSQRFWDNMERVSPAQIAAVEDDLARTAVAHFGLDLHCLLFDATNFYTFHDSFNLRAQLHQRGHSKEGRDNLRILGLALLVSADSEVPLFHHTYAGNQHDAVTFHGVVEELLQRCGSLAQQVRDITLVFDKGNNSEDNLKILQKSAVHFIGSLVPTHTPIFWPFPERKCTAWIGPNCRRCGPIEPTKWFLGWNVPSWSPLTGSCFVPRPGRWSGRSANGKASWRSYRASSAAAVRVTEGKSPR